MSRAEFGGLLFSFFVSVLVTAVGMKIENGWVVMGGLFGCLGVLFVWCYLDCRDYFTRK